MPFNTPFAFGDEYLYTIYSKEIILNPYQILFPTNTEFYPPGYSIFTIPAFLFYPNMALVYRSIQLLNILASTSILFISYFLLQNYCSKWIAICGSVFISILPVNTLYCFMILSENLYIPLLTLSGLLLLKSVETNNRTFQFLAAFAIFFLTIVKPYGFIALFALFIVLLYTLNYFKEEKRSFLYNKLFLFVIPCVLIGLWYIIKILFSNSLFRYNTNSYINTFLYIFSSTPNLIIAFELFLHEIDYFILTGYVIFFALFIIILFYWKNIKLPLRAYIIYIYIYTAFSIIPTVLHMLRIVYNPSHEQYLYYFIWGRYIDPALPSIFIISLICWNNFFIEDRNNSSQKNWEYLRLSIIIGLLGLLIIVSYPYDAIYKAANTLPIQYTQEISYRPVFLFYSLIILFIGIFLLFRKKPVVFLSIMIVISLIISVPGYSWLAVVSVKADDKNEIGNYLQKNHIVNKSILLDIDWESFKNRYVLDHMLVKFWGMPNNFLYGNITDYNNTRIDYIISKQNLPYEILAISSDNIKLYQPKEPSQLQLIPLNGFHLFEYDNNRIQNIWMSNNGSISIYMPFSFQEFGHYTIILDANSFNDTRTVYFYKDEKFLNSVEISQNKTRIYLPLMIHSGDNTVRMFTPEGCKRPCDVIMSGDTRCISIHFDQISIIPTNINRSNL